MKRKDYILALLVALMWGANYTNIKLSLNEVPSMLLVAIRYILVIFPAIFFVKKPNIEWKYIIYYGLTAGLAQFACLFYAIEKGMHAGLASIIVQLQAFVSPFLGAILLKEKINFKQFIGFVVAAIGVTIIGIASTANGITSIPIKALLFTVCAPIFWSISNIIARYASDRSIEMGIKLDMLGLVVWSSLVPPIPMLGLALLIDTPATLINSVINLRFSAIFSILYMSYVATMLAYVIWSGLVTKYPLNKISPTSLLVPVTGLLTARVVLSEQLSKMQWIGTSIILIGLIISNINIKRIHKSKMI